MNPNSSYCLGHVPPGAPVPVRHEIDLNVENIRGDGSATNSFLAIIDQLCVETKHAARFGVKLMAMGFLTRQKLDEIMDEKDDNARCHKIYREAIKVNISWEKLFHALQTSNNYNVIDFIKQNIFLGVMFATPKPPQHQSHGEEVQPDPEPHHYDHHHHHHHQGQNPHHQLNPHHYQQQHQQQHQHQQEHPHGFQLDQQQHTTPQSISQHEESSTNVLFPMDSYTQGHRQNQTPISYTHNPYDDPKFSHAEQFPSHILPQPEPVPEPIPEPGPEQITVQIPMQIPMRSSVIQQVPTSRLFVPAPEFATSITGETDPAVDPSLIPIGFEAITPPKENAARQNKTPAKKTRSRTRNVQKKSNSNSGKTTLPTSTSKSKSKSSPKEISTSKSKANKKAKSNSKQKTNSKLKASNKGSKKQNNTSTSSSTTTRSSNTKKSPTKATLSAVDIATGSGPTPDPDTTTTPSKVLRPIKNPPVTKSSETTGGSTKGRKRRKQATPEEWLRVKNKMLRMQGQAYLGYTKVKVEEGQGGGASSGSDNKNNIILAVRKQRTIGPPCDAAHCLKGKSGTHCTEFSEAARQVLFDSFWKKMNWEQRKIYVASHVDVMPVKKSTVKGRESKRALSLVYMLKLNGEKQRVCKKMFLRTLGVGAKAVNSWVLKASDNFVTAPSKVGIPRNKVESEDCDSDEEGEDEDDQ